MDSNKYIYCWRRFCKEAVTALLAEVRLYVSSESPLRACRGREGNGRIQLSQKTGLPVLSKPDPVPSQGPALSAQEAAESTHKAAAARKPDESQEEKRQRKGAVKEAKV